MTGKDDIKSESFTMGSADLGVLMSDPYSEEDARILSTACYFTSDDVDDQEEGMQLFGAASEGIKSDYNWDQCFANLEDVDNLLSSGPELTFGPATANSAVDSMQWRDSASPPAVLSENGTIPKSPLRSECGATTNGKLDGTNLRMEFVPGDPRLTRPALDKAKAGVKTAEYMPADERWSAPQAGSQFMASDCLQDGEAMAADVPLPKRNGTCVGMDMSEDGTGASSVSHSDSEKASIAQAQRARRHAANRKRDEARSRRQLNHRKFVHGSAYSNGVAPPPHMLQPIPMQLPAHSNHFNQPSTAALYGFAAPRLNTSPMQPMMRPAPPYIHVGHNPAMRHIQPVPPTTVSPQVQPGLFLGYQQPCSFQPVAAAQHQQFQLRPPVDAPICPPPSSASMTPQEKIEKLRYLQQMQARFAVEQQQQQFVAQGVTPMDSSPSPSHGNVPAQLPQVMPVRQPDVAVTGSEMKMSGVESDFEPSLSVGQTSLETTSEDECGSVEAVVLDQLQNAMKSLEVETKLCIRDALYRLARSAMRRKGTGGRGGGEESCSITQASEDGDCASDGLETSINSDPCSSSRVSRMNMNMVETQTNPIDRSIAHLLFYKTQQLQAAPTAPNGCVVRPQLGIPDSQTNPSTWHQGDLPQNSWRPSAPLALPVTGAVQGVVAGVEIGAAPLLRPPVALVIPSPSVTRFQTSPGMVAPLIAEGGQQLQSTMIGTGVANGELSSPMGSQCQPRPNVEEQRPSQTQVAPLSAHKVSLECRNGVRSSKRLEHAVGLKELSQVLIEGLDVESGSLCGDETSGPPVSNSGACEEGQAGNCERSQPSRSYPSQRGSILC